MKTTRRTVSVAMLAGGLALSGLPAPVHSQENHWYTLGHGHAAAFDRSAVEIPDYPPRDSADKKLLESRQREVIKKVLGMGLYAVINVPAPSPDRNQPLNPKLELAAQQIRAWAITPEAGDTFPFVGIQGHEAWLLIGAQRMKVPLSAISILPVSEHPELLQRYTDKLNRIRAEEESLLARIEREQSNADLPALRAQVQQFDEYPKPGSQGSR